MDLFLLILPIVIGLGVFLVFASFLIGQQLDPVQAWLQQISVRPRTLEELELQRPITERTIKPIVQGLASIVARLYPANTARSLQIKLKRAAMETTSVEFFLGVKAFVAIVVAIGASSLVNLLTADALFTLGGVAGGAILAELPDALDLLTISVEAGLGFDAAIIKVTEKMKGPLTEEFKRAAAEQRVGKSRQEALRGINDRVDVKELQNFISAIIQADQLGVSMSKVLRIQSETLRTERRQRAEEKAARAPILIMLPTVGCIFPSLFIVILAPAALSAMKSCGSV